MDCVPLVLQSSNLIKDHIYTIDRLPSCRYCFAIQASLRPRITKTEEKCFGITNSLAHLFRKQVLKSPVWWSLVESTFDVCFFPCTFFNRCRPEPLFACCHLCPTDMRCSGSARLGVLHKVCCFFLICLLLSASLLEPPKGIHKVIRLFCVFMCH